MTFISYSQNREDVLLWRALHHVSRGFYVDVGANDPNDDSVTKAFYDRGWHGINIEPLPEHMQRLRELRPHDINLEMAAGAADGELALFDVPAVRGWATSAPQIAQLHRDQGHVVEASTVPVRRLSAICDEWVSGEIHFLKIDVEGFEAEVIAGMDFERWRPWVVVVEATLPGSKVSSHAGWEPALLRSRYRLVHFDGLNRFYLADEHAELGESFATPPNVFDEYVFIGQVNAEAAVQAAGERLEQVHLSTRLEVVEAQAAAAHASAACAEAARANSVAEARLQALDARLQGAQAAAKAQVDAANALRQSAENSALMAQAKAQLAHHLQEQAQAVSRAARLEASAALDQLEASDVHARNEQVHAVYQQALAAAADAGCRRAEQAAAELRQHLDAVYRSRSWQVTKPLRFALRVVLGIRSGAVQRRLRARLDGMRASETTAEQSPAAAPAHSSDALVQHVPLPLVVMTDPAPPQHVIRLTAAARRILRDIERTSEKP
ncbi:MAG: FkbM family methyltransferase [Herminiimonas sp.]|nr:FkbM family methyltransferase [Herminiimonas sp.]